MPTLNSKPNVLLLTIDTLRADMLSCYGYPSPITPNIDRLASGGIRFRQAITGGSWTQAAFPVIMTSTYASMHGGCLGPLSPARPSPIEAMANNGYTTVGFSTSPLVSKTYGYQRGFDNFIDLIPRERDPLLRRVKGGERLLGMPVTHYLASLVGKQIPPARLYVSAEKLVDTAGGWFKERSEPFFAWMHFMDIHWPYHLKETMTTPPDIARVWREMRHLHRVNWRGESINEAQRERYLDLYLRSVRYTDVQIGRLLHILESEGLMENTVIVLLSDHGEELLERGKWGHFETNLFDEILKVPLIIYQPGLKSGMVVENQVRLLDVMPTILEICQIPRPEGMEGVSLSPLWRSGESEYGVDYSISEMWRDIRHIVAVRSVLFKYIWDSRSPDQPALYNLQLDTKERNNIVQQFPEKAKFFQSIVDGHLRRVADSGDRGVAEPELEDAMVRRLRDLGYVE
jgi:arylsulfatase